MRGGIAMTTKRQPLKITRDEFLAKLETMATTPELGESRDLEDELAKFVGWDTTLDIFLKSERLYYSVPKDERAKQAGQLYLRLAIDAIRSHS
jgi:hypothetical protein